MKYLRMIAIISTLVSFSGCDSASYNDQLEQDLNRFCQTYAKQNWENIQGVNSISEMEIYVNNLAKNAVDNQQLKDIVDEIPAIVFYRQVYPEVKEKVEALYGKEWDCPELEAFYTPTIIDPLEESGASIKVVLNSSGEFFIDGEKLSLTDSNIDTIKPYFIVNGTRVDKVHIILQEQTSEALLQPLLNVLPLLGIHHVTFETS